MFTKLKLAVITASFSFVIKKSASLRTLGVKSDPHGAIAELAAEAFNALSVNCTSV